MTILPSNLLDSVVRGENFWIFSLQYMDIISMYSMNVKVNE